MHTFLELVHMKLNQLVYENVHTITGSPIKRTLDSKMLVTVIALKFRAITVTSIFRSFTYKMVAKTGWHRYRTKLRRYHHVFCICLWVAR